MKEFVMDEQEFEDLTNGSRIHYTIRKEPVFITRNDGTGKVQSGELHLIMSVSGISKEDSRHLVLLEINFGIKHPNEKDYPEYLDKIRSYAKDKFPKATAGAWTY